MKWEIIHPERFDETTKGSRTLTSHDADDWSSLREKESQYGKHYCPCCNGWGSGEGVSLCRFCDERECGDERLAFDAKNKSSGGK